MGKQNAELPGTSPFAPALQVLYADTVERARSQELVFVSSPGTIVPVTKGGNTYLYRRTYATAGKRRDEYLGRADDPNALRKAEELRERMAEARALAEDSRSASPRRLRPRGQLGGGDARRALQCGTFSARSTLIGTHAYGTLLNTLGVRLPAHYYTEDLDIARYDTIQLAVGRDQKFLDLLLSSGMRFVEVPELDVRRPSTSFRARGTRSICSCRETSATGRSASPNSARTRPRCPIWPICWSSRSTSWSSPVTMSARRRSSRAGTGLAAHRSEASRRTAMARVVNGLELLRKEHQEVDRLFRRFEKLGEVQEQQALAQEIVTALQHHAQLEEDVFYPFLREATGREDLVEEAAIEHQTAKELMGELQSVEAGTPRYAAIVTVMSEYVRHHVEEEEERIFPVVEKLGIDLEALGDELATHKHALEGNGSGEPRRTARKAKLGRRARGENGGSSSHAENDGGASAEESEPGIDTSADDERFLKEHREDLSSSTRRGKWIHHPDEHEDRPGQTLATRNHDVIRRWAEARQGVPATSPNGDAAHPRVLRFDFPGAEKKLQEVSWDAWFGTFDERELVFLFQEHMKAGNPSNFFRLDSPAREDG